MASNIANDAELARTFPTLHERSHGQSFLTLLDAWFTSAGLYLLDEPESALSFQGQLQLLRLIRDGVASGFQFVVATHSPILMHAVGGTIYEFDDHGMRTVAYDDMVAVGPWRRFLDDPDPILHVLYDDSDTT
jgi:predicted ATPase